MSFSPTLPTSTPSSLENLVVPRDQEAGTSQQNVEHPAAEPAEADLTINEENNDQEEETEPTNESQE